MATVSNLLSGIYEYLGRPSQDKLSLGQVLPLLLDTVDFYNVDLQLSSENWLLKSHIYTPTAKDAAVSVTGNDFSVPVAVEIRNAESENESDWEGILIANISGLQDIGRDGTKAVSFYATGTTAPRIAFSFDPAEYAVEVKIWYEPIAAQPTALSGSPNISTAFHSMLKLRTALLCLPHVAPGNEALAGTLGAQLEQWERKWKLWANMDRNARPVLKRDFRGGRRGYSAVIGRHD